MGGLLSEGLILLCARSGLNGDEELMYDLPISQLTQTIGGGVL